MKNDKEPEKEILPAQFGRYKIEKLLGKGAMGAVYLAKDPVLDRKVAIKVISLEHTLKKATREDYGKRFLVEAKASAKLYHPSIVAVYDAADEDDFPWIAFQFIEGETLEHLITRKGKLSIKRSITFAMDIASALEHAHNLKIIHRDVKPANILVEDATQIAKLADFGIVKAPWDTMTKQGDTLGSPGYMSPEQIEGSDLDERADIFCLGVVLYQMLTGQHPFLRDTLASTAYATCNGTFFPLSDFISNIPDGLDYCVRSCLAPDRKNRIRSASELLRILQDIPVSGPDTQKFSALSKTSGTAIEHGDPFLIKTTGKHWFHACKKYCAHLIEKGKPIMQTGYIRVKNECAKTMGYPLYKDPEPNLISLIKYLPRAVKTVDKSLFTTPLFLGSLGACILIGGVFVVLIFSTIPTLPKKGSAEFSLMQQCSTALETNNRQSALDALAKLSRINTKHAHVQILLACVQIRDGKFDQAAGSLLRVKQLKGGNAAFEREKGALLQEVEHLLKRGEASDELLTIAVKYLEAAKKPLIREWLKDTNYWLRWNAVKICRLSHKKVDLVPVYIQDLDFAGNAQTRLLSVKKLGELKDKRAIPELIKLRDLGDNDPLVSKEADRVLTEVFKVKN
jgi:serine/threonine protein kinase